MEVEGIQIDELNPISGRKKQIIIGIVAIIVLILIAVLLVSLSQPTALTAYFTNSKIKPGASTELVVVFRNIGNTDLHNVKFKVSAESKSILVNNSEHTEPTIGSGAYRKIIFGIAANKTLTQGTYKINVLVDAGNKTYSKNVYLDITQ